MHREESTPTTTQSIPLEEIRTIPEIINVSFDYFRARYGVLRPILLKYILPIFLIAQIISNGLGVNPFGQILERIIGFNIGLGSAGALINLLGIVSSDTMLALMIFGSLLNSIGTALLIAVAYGAMNLDYLYDNSDGFGFDANDLWEETKSHLGMIILTTIGFALLLGITFFLLMRFIGPIDLIGPILFLLSIIALPAFLVYWSLLFPVRIFEQGTFNRSFERSRQLVLHRWWPTFGMAAIFFILFTVISFIEMIPVLSIRLLMMMGVVFPDPTVILILLLIVSSGVGTFSALLIIIPIVAFGFHFFSQRERWEGVSLLAEADAIGSDDGIDTPGTIDDDLPDTLDPNGAFHAA